MLVSVIDLHADLLKNQLFGRAAQKLDAVRGNCLVRRSATRC